MNYSGYCNRGRKVIDEINGIIRKDREDENVEKCGLARVY